MRHLLFAAFRASHSKGPTRQPLSDRGTSVALHSPLKGVWGMAMRVVTCLLLLAMGTVGIRSQDHLQMKVSPTHWFAPATLRVRVRVEPNANNRALAIVADSDAYYRSSVIELEGDASPRTFWMDFRQVPAGQYRISAVLRDGAGRDTAVQIRDVRVIGLTGEP